MQSKSHSDEIVSNIKGNSSFCCGPVSSSLRKLAALDCFEKNKIETGIHHLTESHALGFRSTILTKSSRLNRLQTKYLNLPHISFDPNFISFDSEFTDENGEGLRKRLQELPEEWTLVQITQVFSPKTRCTPREAETPNSNSALHITRLPCGPKARKPFFITLPEAEDATERIRSIFETISMSLNPVVKNCTPSKMLREFCVPGSKVFPKFCSVSKSSREEYSQKLKLLVDEISTNWLQQWRCLFLGQLCSSELNNKIVETVDSVLHNCKSKIGENEKSLLYQIMDGCGHLDDEEIQAAVSKCIQNQRVCKSMIAAVKNFKNANPSLVIAKRYPVLLILDETLDRLPWEMMPVIKRHPVSRIFSVHFAHALYSKYKDSISDGCFALKESDGGYFIINPDKDLDKMEKKICDFLSSRGTSWNGVAGKPPTNEEYSSAVTKHSLLLYCGHGNGTQHFSSETIFSLNVKAVPLLFGCSSVKMNDLGGRVSLSGIAMRYITAGSPCVLGMLWKVTSNDADNMSISLLNNWLPGDPVQISKFIKGDLEITIKSEPELLRNLRYARESCIYYTNAAALVVYGIPVKFS